MRALKIFAAAAAALAVLLVGAGAALYVWFDPNDYKDYLTRWAETQTGRKISIDDKLELRLFPWLAIETGGITIGNAEGFGDGPLAAVTHAAAEVKLWPLLSKHLEIGTIRLDGLQLHLAEDADGRGNWEDLLGGGADSGKDTAAAPPASGGSADWLGTFDIAGVRISGSRVDWRDDSGPRYVVSGLSLESGEIRAGAPVRLSAKLNFRDVESQLSVDLDAHTAAQLEPSGIELGKTQLEAHVTGSSFGAGAFDAAADWTRAAYDLKSGSLQVDGLSTKVGNLRADWKLSGRNLPGSPAIDGQLSIESGSAAEALKLLGLPAPQGVEPEALGSFDLSTSFKAALSPAAGGSGFEPESVELDGLHARLLGVSIEGSAHVADGRHLEAELTVPAFTPSNTLLAIVRSAAPQDLGLNVDALGRAAFSGTIDADLASGRAAIDGIEAQLFGANLTGKVEIVPQDGGSAYRGKLETSRFAPDGLVAFLGSALSAKVVPSKLGTLALDTSFAYDPKGDSLALDPLALEAFGLKADGSMTIAHVSAEPVLKGKAHLPAFSPRDLLRRFGQPAPATSDAQVLKQASITTSYEIAPGRARFDGMTLALDDSRITGDFTVIGVKDPAYRFSLAIDHVDADRYLPPSGRGRTAAGAAKDRPPTAGDIELPAEALGNLKIDGSVRVGKLKLANLQLADVATNIKIAGGEARLEKAGAKLYGGRFDGSFDVKTASGHPGLALTGQAVGLDLAPLIAALTGEKANFSGKGDFNLQLSGQGAKIIDNVRSASGKVKFSLKNGAISGFNLGRSLCAVYNVTQKLPAPAAQPKLTRYQLVSGTATVAHGVASSSDLLARASFMDVTGSGSLKLAAQQLDYALEAKLTGKIGIAGCESMQPLIGESIPLTLRGTVTDPSISPDFHEIIERRLKKKLQNRLQDRLEQRLKDLL